jgi:hypothetical protein
MSNETNYQLKTVLKGYEGMIEASDNGEIIGRMFVRYVRDGRGVMFSEEEWCDSRYDKAIVYPLLSSKVKEMADTFDHEKEKIPQPKTMVVLTYELEGPSSGIVTEVQAALDSGRLMIAMSDIQKEIDPAILDYYPGSKNSLVLPARFKANAILSAASEIASESIARAKAADEERKAALRKARREGVSKDERHRKMSQQSSS